MKKIILGFALFVGGVSAQAAQIPVFKCTVPAPIPTVVVDIAVSDSESIDYVTVDLNDKGMTNLFIQMQKGQFKSQVDAGSITTVVFGNQFSQGDDGVIRDAGIIGLSLENGKWTGLLSAKSNVYPLECNKL